MFSSFFKAFSKNKKLFGGPCINNRNTNIWSVLIGESKYKIAIKSFSQNLSFGVDFKL